MIKDIFQNSFIVGGTQVIAKGLGLLVTILLTRMLNVNDYGKYLLIFSVYGLVNGLLDLRLRQAVIRYISINREKGKMVFEIIKSSFLLEAILGILSILIILIFGEYFALKIIKDVNSIYLIRFAVIIALLAVFLRNFNAVFQALEKFIQYSAINISSIVFVLLSLVILFLIGKTVSIKTALLVQMGASFITLLIATIMLFYIFRNIIKDISFSISAYWIKKLLIFSVFPFISASLAILVYSANTYLIAYFLTTGMVAYYAIGYSFSKIITMIINPITTVIYPKVGREYGRGNIDFLIKLYKSYPKYLVILFSPIVVLLFVYAPQVITLIYTPKYLPSVIILRIGIFGILFYQLAGINNVILLTMKKQYVITISSVICLISIVTGSIILIPLLGITGAAIASTISYFISSMYVLKMTAKYLKTKMPLFNIIIPTILVILFVVVQNLYQSRMNAIITFISIIGFFLVYSIILRVIKIIDTDDISFIKNLLKEFKFARTK